MKLAIKTTIKSLPFGESLWVFLGVARNICFAPRKLSIILDAIKITFNSSKEETFSGWSMVTHAAPPWAGEDEFSQDFRTTNNNFLELINSNKFKLSKIAGIHGPKDIIGLAWRHFNIFWSVKHAINATGSGQSNFVECGVCNGMSTYYAINSAMLVKSCQPKFYLYDSWEGMKGEYLTASEKAQGLAGEYSDLKIDTIKSNLKEFEDITVFNKGFLPESLKYSDNPDNLIWMHIDLNSAKPTVSALKYFYDKMSPGGVILFDDYAWNSYADTKKAVDKFFETKTGITFSLPTGQAIHFKLI